MIAGELLNLLSLRHSDDVFVPECKDGPTWGGSHLRMDAWAMRKSWSNPCCWGYEIKVSRRDFVQDEKAHGYLAYCNEFYFVAPKGLIGESELPEHAGLLVVAGTRLVCKKKAAHRQVEIPDSLFRYLLMSRTKIIERFENDPTKMDRVRMFKEHFENKTLRRDIARLIGSDLRHRIEDQERRIDRLTRYRKLTKSLEEQLVKMGIDPEGNLDWTAESQMCSRLRAACGDTDGLRRAANEVEAGIARLLQNLDRANGAKVVA